MNISKGLIIDEPWIDYLLDGRKTWEMRSTSTGFRGWFGLIRKGSGLVVGVARLVNVGARLSASEMLATTETHRIPGELIRSGAVDKWRTPWVLESVQKLPNPVPYRHKSGAVTWVNLERSVSSAIASQIADSRSGGRRAFAAEGLIGATHEISGKTKDATNGEMTLQTPEKSARQHVFEGMEHMRNGLHPFVLRSLESGLGPEWPQRVLENFSRWRPEQNGEIHIDTQKLLQLMERFWNECFRDHLQRTHRAIVNELLDVRNKLAHDVHFSDDDAERALDSMRRLLDAAGASDSAKNIADMRAEILRTRYGAHETIDGPISVPPEMAAHRGMAHQVEDSAPCPSAEHTSGPSANVGRVVGKVEITQGNLDHNHIYLRSFFDRFPKDAVGGSNKTTKASREITVDWGGGEPVVTDLDGSKKFFRARGWIRKFFEANSARPGDVVQVYQAAPYEYRVHLKKRNTA